MKILSRNAASLLFEKVKSLTQYHNSWRCIYINLSDKQERGSRAMHAHFVVKAVTGLLSNAEGYIYLCDDGDVFILFQGPLRPVLNRLGKHFEELKPENLSLEPGNPFVIFDLSMAWDSFYDLCKTKAFLERVSAMEQVSIPFAYAQFAPQNEVVQE